MKKPQVLFKSHAEDCWLVPCCIKQKPPFCAKICSDICPWTYSVPRSEQFFDSVTRGTANFKEHTCIMSNEKYPSFFRTKLWNIFWTRAIFWKLGNITGIFASFSWGTFSHVSRYIFITDPTKNNVLIKDLFRSLFVPSSDLSVNARAWGGTWNLVRKKY